MRFSLVSCTPPVLPLQDVFCEELELVQEDLLANDLVIEGEFMSEETMKTEWKWSQ